MMTRTSRMIITRKTASAGPGPASTSAQKEKTPEESSEKRSSGGAEAEGEKDQQKDESGTTLPCPTPISQTPPSPTTQVISTILKASTSSNPKEPKKIDLSSSEETSYEDPSSPPIHTSKVFSKAPKIPDPNLSESVTIPILTQRLKSSNPETSNPEPRPRAISGSVAEDVVRLFSQSKV